MWIKEIPNDYTSKSSFFDNALFLWRCNERPIYVMDNHLSAAWCWMQECNPKNRYNFMHIDRHSDLKGCGHPKDIEFLRNTPHISFKEYTQITYKNPDECLFFQWDNYIRACHHLFPQWFNSNLFYTYSDNNRSSNDWGYDAFPTQSREGLSLRQDFINYIKNPETDLCENIVPKEFQYNKWIVNIDLDFFWDFEGIKIFDNQYIDDFARIINASMDNIQVLTIALSPECIGGDSFEDKWNNVKEVLGVMKSEIKGLSDCSF